MQRTIVGGETRHYTGLTGLTDRFHDSLGDLADFLQTTAPEMPGSYQRLLDHAAHMTVTMEQFHGSRVKLSVLQRCIDRPWYSREILLSRASDGRVVQYGIAHLNLNQLDEELVEEIESENAPLGILLSPYDVLRRVTVDSLWTVYTGPILMGLFGLSQRTETYGRTATIDYRGTRAIHVLEIVSPVGS